MRRYCVLALAAVAAAGLGGCYETATPKMYEPGVYKGSQDSLGNKLDNEELDQQLSERFRTAAQDR
ncbi:MAG: hypothetical protein U5K73_00650 [Halofilum sp. (in: g-proteobacteria)]|nr:hypothetical protein [Halofilum sp. (in: g-proteobacteria)]